MIIQAAIIVEGFVCIGHRHNDIIHNYYKKTGQKIGGTQGFLTDKGEFVNRIDAKRHAIECGQITESEYPGLYSEDLW